MSTVMISPTLDCYDLDVEQVFEDYGDFRPILLAASEGDGTGKLAIDTILTRKFEDGENNGLGVFVPGSGVGMPLMEDQDLKAGILDTFDLGWNIQPI